MIGIGIGIGVRAPSKGVEDPGEPLPVGDLLLESGDSLLLESGDKILMEN